MRFFVHFVCSFVHSFVRSFGFLFVRSLFCLSVHCFVCPFIFLFVHSFVCLFVHLSVCSFVYFLLFNLFVCCLFFLALIKKLQRYEREVFIVSSPISSPEVIQSKNSLDLAEIHLFCSNQTPEKMDIQVISVYHSHANCKNTEINQKKLFLLPNVVSALF